MTWQQTIDEEKYYARKEGREEGAHENAITSAKNLLLLHKLSVEEIAQCCSLPLDEVLALQKELEN